MAVHTQIIVMIHDDDALWLHLCDSQTTKMPLSFSITHRKGNIGTPLHKGERAIVKASLSPRA